MTAAIISPGAGVCPASPCFPALYPELAETRFQTAEAPYSLTAPLLLSRRPGMDTGEGPLAPVAEEPVCATVRAPVGPSWHTAGVLHFSRMACIYTLSTDRGWQSHHRRGLELPQHVRKYSAAAYSGPGGSSTPVCSSLGFHGYQDVMTSETGAQEGLGGWYEGAAPAKALSS